MKNRISIQEMKDNLSAWSKINFRGCWILKRGKNSERGYTKLGFNGKFYGGHRLSYQLFNGPIQNGKYVCHSCDEPSCVNPKHLFLGSSRDNMIDCIRKGRLSFAKLTIKKVHEIRERISVGDCSLRSIARDYKIDHKTIVKIKDGRAWGYV